MLLIYYFFGYATRSPLSFIGFAPFSTIECGKIVSEYFEFPIIFETKYRRVTRRVVYQSGGCRVLKKKMIIPRKNRAERIR